MKNHIDAELITEPLDEINRTGIMLNPEMALELIRSAEETIPSSEGNGDDIALERSEYLQKGQQIGAYPAVINGPVNGEVEELPDSDQRMAVLLDKLGERLGFERQGTRLYEAFIQKIEAMPIDDSNAPSPEDLRHIYDEEREHFELLQREIVKLGGDATVQTPAADVAGVLSLGALQIVSDPRTTIAQTLQAALTAELCDNDGWQMLKDLAEQLGQTELAEQCAAAFEKEQEHLENVRTWLSHMVLSDAVGDDGLESAAKIENSGKRRTNKRSTATNQTARGTKNKSARKQRKK